MNRTALKTLQVSAAFTTMLIPSICLGQVDPGVRGGPPGAGNPVSPIQVNELAMFTEGKVRVTELEATCNGCSQVTPGGSSGEDPFLVTKTNSAGLGARFNPDHGITRHRRPAIHERARVPRSSLEARPTH